MKNLSEYINDTYIHYNLPRYSGFCTFEEYCDLNGFVEENLTEEQIQYYYKNVFSTGSVGERSHLGYENNILEMLDSHSSKKLVEKFESIFPKEYIISYYTNKQLRSKVIMVQVPLMNDLVSKLNYKSNKIKNTSLGKKVKDLLHYYNYYVTDIQFFEDASKFEIYFEAEKSHNVSIDVLESGNIVYHVTKKENLEKILKRGLRPQVGKCQDENCYRYFPERLFFVKHSKDYIDDIKDVITDKDYKLGEYVIFKIHLKHHEISFFVDDVAKNKNAIYTVEAIPPALLNDYVFDINEL